VQESSLTEKQILEDCQDHKLQAGDMAVLRKRDIVLILSDFSVSERWVFVLHDGIQKWVPAADLSQLDMYET